WKDVDDLVTMEIADQGRSPYLLGLAGRALATCGAGGEQAQPGGAPGYMFFGPSDAEFRTEIVANADPLGMNAVLDVPRLRDRNPCGWVQSALQAFDANLVHDREITVPVLLIYADDSQIFTREGEDAQLANYQGAEDKTTLRLPNTGHFPMLERTA